MMTHRLLGQFPPRSPRVDAEGNPLAPKCASSLLTLLQWLQREEALHSIDLRDRRFRRDSARKMEMDSLHLWDRSEKFCQHHTKQCPVNMFDQREEATLILVRSALVLVELVTDEAL